MGHGSAVVRITIRPVGMFNVRARRPHRSSAAGVHDDDAYPPLESGLQVPAGTAHAGEQPADAVLREAFEETGLVGLRILCWNATRSHGPASGRWSTTSLISGSTMARPAAARRRRRPAAVPNSSAVLVPVREGRARRCAGSVVHMSRHTSDEARAVLHDESCERRVIRMRAAVASRLRGESIPAARGESSTHRPSLTDPGALAVVARSRGRVSATETAGRSAPARVVTASRTRSAQHPRSPHQRRRVARFAPPGT